MSFLWISDPTTIISLYRIKYILYIPDLRL